MGRNSVEYEPLAPTTEESSEVSGLEYARRHNSRKWLYILGPICFLQAIVILLQWLSNAREILTKECLEPRMLYSPAYEVIEPEIKVFTVGLSWPGFTRWQGKSPETDSAWQELYNNTILRIPKEQAALLPNRTVPIVDDPEGYYISQIDVFHQLHCLNMIRMKVGGDYYKGMSYEMDEDHISHCIDGIRQSLMCSADTSVNVWQWSDNANVLVGHSTQAHQCRNFEKLRDWAQEHGMYGEEVPRDKKPPVDDLQWPHDIYSDGTRSEEEGLPHHALYMGPIRP